MTCATITPIPHGISAARFAYLYSLRMQRHHAELVELTFVELGSGKC